MIPGRIVGLGVAALLLAGAGIGVAATRDDSSETASVAPPPAEQSAVTTTSTEPPTTTTAVPDTTTPPTTRAGSPSTTVRRTTTTVARATTTRPPGPTTTTRPSATPACSPAQISGTVATDKPSYVTGQEVRVTSTLRNGSSAPCLYNGYGFTSAFKDQAGATLVAQSVIADSFADVPLRPGETVTHAASWNQRVCPESSCGPAPPNPYFAAVTWTVGPYTYEFSTSFILR